MMKSKHITPATLSELVIYYPHTGYFFWRKRHHKYFAHARRSSKINASIWNKRHAGKQCFLHMAGSGYLANSILGKTITAHQAAWALHYGEWPCHHIDHTNVDSLDNRIANLRATTPHLNSLNTRPINGGSSKYKGVCWHKTNKRWIASIRIHKVRTHIGYYNSEKEAALAYDKKANEVFGDAIRINFS